MTAPHMELRRPPQAPPTEPGWYYARHKDDAFAGTDATPCRVAYWNEALWVRADADWFKVGNYYWYGSVPTCVPATGI